LHTKTSTIKDDKKNWKKTKKKSGRKKKNTDGRGRRPDCGGKKISKKAKQSRSDHGTAVGEEWDSKSREIKNQIHPLAMPGEKEAEDGGLHNVEQKIN